MMITSPLQIFFCSSDQSLFACDFGNGSLGSQISKEDLNMAGGFDRVAQGSYDGLTGLEPRQILQVFRECFTRDRHAIAAEQALGEQILHHRWGATDRMQVLLNELARRL